MLIIFKHRLSFINFFLIDIKYIFNIFTSNLQHFKNTKNTGLHSPAVTNIDGKL